MAATDGTGRRVFTFVLAEGFDRATGCWMSAGGHCLLVATGDSIQLGEGWYSGYRLTGQFRLSDEGALEGHVAEQNNEPGTPVPARIPLLD